MINCLMGDTFCSSSWSSGLIILVEYYGLRESEGGRERDMCGWVSKDVTVLNASGDSGHVGAKIEDELVSTLAQLAKLVISQFTFWGCQAARPMYWESYLIWSNGGDHIFTLNRCMTHITLYLKLLYKLNDWICTKYMGVNNGACRRCFIWNWHTISVLDAIYYSRTCVG